MTVLSKEDKTGGLEMKSNEDGREVVERHKYLAMVRIIYVETGRSDKKGNRMISCGYGR